MANINVETDDQPVYTIVDGLATGEIVEDLVDLRGLTEQGINAQRLAMMRLTRAYTKGRMEVAYSDGRTPPIAEKMFKLSKLIQWNDGEPTVVIDELLKGRLRARLSAKMGLGKSTRLPTYVASAMGYRVLYVALDASAIQQVVVYMHEAGIGKISRRWSESPTSMVSCMTYKDFCGYMNMGKRSILFKCFDLIIFDEAFFASADVFAAKRLFANYADDKISLLCCSATIRSDLSEDEVVSSGVGQFKVMNGSMSVEDAINSEHQGLFTKYLRDRTLTLVPDNESVEAMADAYASYGVQVRKLDDASSYEDLRDVESFLSGEGSDVRVVVAHSDYGIAYNFPVAYVVLFPELSVMVSDGKEITFEKRFMSKELIAQAKARTGRSIVGESGGVVMSPEVAEEEELPESERLKAFVNLCAAGVIPMKRSGLWTAAYRIFPEGLAAPVAQSILKVCLPIEVTVRYLADDGYFASHYCRALNAFAQPDHFLRASDHEFPTGHDMWYKEDLLFSTGEEITVPMRCHGELAIVVHCVEAMSKGRIVIPRWQPKRFLAMNDGYDSDEEQGDSRFKITKGLRLRKVDDAKPLPAPPMKKQIEAGWSYAGGGGANKRDAFVFDSERMKRALAILDSQVNDYKIPSGESGELVETDEGTMKSFSEDKSLGVVESPGGSEVCLLPAAICEKMNCGRELSPEEVVRLIVGVKSVVDRFVQSKMFDALSACWDSVLDSLLLQRCVEQLVKKGLASDTYRIVDLLRVRFSIETSTYLQQSNTYKTVYLKIFKKTPSFNTVMSAIRNGKFDYIAQTDNYLHRVKRVKEKIDKVLVFAENSSIYLPNYITEAQRTMALRGDSVVGYVGSDLIEMPRSWSKAIEGVGKPKKIVRPFRND